MDHYVMTWSEKLAIGEPECDRQHRELIGLIAEIPDTPSPLDDQLIARALDYAGMHFKSEEAHMAKIGYLGLEEHKRAHKTLVRMIESHKRDYECGNADLYSFKHFMYRWVRDHIMDEDRIIGEFERSHAP